MGGCGSYLNGHVDALGRLAAEAGDVEFAEAALCTIARQLPDRVEHQRPLDLNPLEAAGLNSQQIARVARTLEVQCIEYLRKMAPSDDFGDCVLALRSTIQKSLPPDAAREKGVARYHDLVHGETAQAHHDLLTAMMRTVPNLVYLHDMAGNLYYLNDFGLEMVGYSRADLAAGLSVHDFVVPDYVDLVESRMVSLRTKVSPFSIEIYAKNGDRIPVEITTRLVTDDDAKQDLVLGIARDLRLERRLQSDIARANDFLDAILTTTPVGILVTDSQFTILEANVAAVDLAGAPSLHALVGVPVTELLDGPRDEVVEWLEAALAGGAECRETMSLRSRFGHPFTCQCVAAPLRKGQGAVGGLLLLLNKADLPESQVEKGSGVDLKALGNVVGRIAHELNNPLTGIIGYAEVLRQLSDDPKFRARLDHVLEESHRCRRIVESLQAFVNRGERTHVPVSLNDIVDEVIQLVGYQMGVQRIRLDVVKTPNLSTVHAGETELRRAILNVLVNAQQALKNVNDQDRAIRIATNVPREGGVSLVIEDNGPGVPAHLAGRIFEPFYTTRDVGEGMGLGLSIAHAVMRECGGTLTCEQADPHGARFVFTFPA